MKRVVSAVGGQIQSTTSDIRAEHIGTCETFEERQIGGERYNIFEGCPKAKTATMLLRGGAEQFIAEIERSLHDAIMIVRRAIKNNNVVAGGGATEMEISKYLRDQSRTIEGKQQAILAAFAKALEIIPRQLCDNAGIDATDALNKLRMLHARGDTWAGIDVESEGVANNMDKFVWEPSLVKINALSGACEAACLILRCVKAFLKGSCKLTLLSIASTRPSKTLSRKRGIQGLRCPEVQCVERCEQEGEAEGDKAVYLVDCSSSKVNQAIQFLPSSSQSRFACLHLPGPIRRFDPHFLPRCCSETRSVRKPPIQAPRCSAWLPSTRSSRDHRT